MTAPEWVALLTRPVPAISPHATDASQRAANTTWLHQYHLGVAALDSVTTPDDAEFNRSEALFQASLVLKESAEALRALAIIDSARGLFASAHKRYLRAMTLANDPADPDPDGAALLVRNLAAEIGQFLTLAPGMEDELVAFIDSEVTPPIGQQQDRYRAAEAHAAFYRKDWSSVLHLLDCAPERQWPTFGYDLGPLLSLYQATLIAQAAQEAGVQELDWRERNAVLRSNKIPICLTAIGH
jgi:hypothetical protein